MQKYKSLKAFARSESQREVMDALIASEGKIREAARKLGIRHSAVQGALMRVERYAALQGYSPEHDLTKVIPDTHYLKGSSTLYGEDGKPKLQWIKTNAKAADMMADLREFAEELGEQARGGFEPIGHRYENATDDDLLTVYPLADLHLGMLAWSAETREDYDARIASDSLRVAAELLTSKAAASERAIIANIGDFFHFDNDTKQTSSGNVLDVDGRWNKVIGLGVECLLYFIRAALEKHKTVRIINSVGNHDGQSGMMLPFILRPYFLNEPRVEIEDAPRDHHYYKFGCNLLGFHHGHKTNPSRLPMAMVNDQLLNPKVDTEDVQFLHWLTGHIHHETKEYDGCLVESFRALCAKDAYHAGGGYRAGREMQAVTYHRHFGELGRDRVSFKMIQHHSRYEHTRKSTKA